MASKIIDWEEQFDLMKNIVLTTGDTSWGTVRNTMLFELDRIYGVNCWTTQLVFSTERESFQNFVKARVMSKAKKEVILWAAQFEVMKQIVARTGLHDWYLVRSYLHQELDKICGVGTWTMEVDSIKGLSDKQVIFSKYIQSKLKEQSADKPIETGSSCEEPKKIIIGASRLLPLIEEIVSELGDPDWTQVVRMLVTQLDRKYGENKWETAVLPEKVREELMARFGVNPRPLAQNVADLTKANVGLSNEVVRLQADKQELHDKNKELLKQLEALRNSEDELKTSVFNLREGLNHLQQVNDIMRNEKIELCTKLNDISCLAKSIIDRVGK